METYEAIFRRRDVRAEYTGQPLDDAVLYSALPTEWPAIKARLETRVERHVSKAH